MNPQRPRCFPYDPGPEMTGQKSRQVSPLPVFSPAAMANRDRKDTGDPLDERTDNRQVRRKTGVEPVMRGAGALPDNTPEKRRRSVFETDECREHPFLCEQPYPVNRSPARYFWDYSKSCAIRGPGPISCNAATSSSVFRGQEPGLALSARQYPR